MVVTLLPVVLRPRGLRPHIAPLLVVEMGGSVALPLLSVALVIPMLFLLLFPLHDPLSQMTSGFLTRCWPFQLLGGRKTKEKEDDG